MDAVRLPSIKDLHLQDLIYFDVLNNIQEEELNHFLELASFTCNCPIAVMSFTDNEKQWIRTNKNSEQSLTQTDLSFCYHVMLQDDIMLRDISSERQLFAVRKENNYPPVLFCAGAPIVNTKGQKLGSLCVMDVMSRKDFSNQQKNALKTIAHLVACMFDLKANNRMAIHDAVEAEKKNTHLAISEQDSERGFIAHKLQENFAQTLAATKLYLEFAEQSEDKKDHFIQKSRDNISTVIDEIKYLCKSMAPAPLGTPDIGEMLRDMIAEWEANNNMYIDFVCGSNLQSLKNHTSFTLFHIIQQQLKLATYYNARKTEISLLQQDNIVLYFSIKDISFSEQDPQQELFIQNIRARVAMIRGEILFESSSLTNDVMRITFPALSI